MRLNRGLGASPRCKPLSAAFARVRLSAAPLCVTSLQLVACLSTQVCLCVCVYVCAQEPAAQRLVLVEEFAANGDLHAVHK